MSDYDNDYISDHESDFSTYSNEYEGGKAEDTGDDDMLIAPADPDEVAEESDNEYFDDSDTEAKEDDEDAPTGEPAEQEIEEEYEEEEPDFVDLKKVSNYNKEIIVVKPENRRTSHILSKYEMTELVSIRATQISQFNNCMVDITGLDDPIKMAKREISLRKSPLILRRHVGDLKDPKTGEIQSYYEYWDPNQMQFAVQYLDVL